MLKMKQQFYSIAAAIVFLILAVLCAYGSTKGGVAFGDMVFGASMGWALCGVLFVMAYFSLVHMVNKKGK